MSDFFGGILDSLRDVGDNPSGFIDGAIGQAVAKGVKGGLTPANKPVPLNMGFYGDQNSEVHYSPTNDDTRPDQAVSYNQIELDWLRRMQRFSQLTSGTEVKLGANK